MNFFTIATLITILTVLLLIIPLLRPRPLCMDAENMNAAILQQQIKELEQDLTEDNITEDQYNLAKQDLELNFAKSLNPEHKPYSNKLKDKIISVAFVAILVPVISFIVYQKIKPQTQTVRTATANSQQGQASIDEMVVSLKEKLKNNPDNLDGWIMLGRSYNVMGKRSESAKAYRKALELAPNDSWIMAQLGFVIAETTGNLTGEPVKLFKRALKLAPDNMDARFMLGKYHFQQQEYKKAAEHWEYLLEIVNATDAVPVRNALNAARSKLGLEPVAKPEATGAGYIEVEIDINPEIKTKVAPDSVVFVFAHAKSGSKIPVAARKTSVDNLPQTIKLDDSMAVLENLSLSKNLPVSIIARLSLSGNPVPKPGDYFAKVDKVKELGQKIKLTINQEVK